VERILPSEYARRFKCTFQSHSFMYSTQQWRIQGSVVQLQARGPHVARYRVFCGPRKHWEKIFQSEICWKTCKVTFFSLNPLGWKRCICTRTINNTFCMPFYFIYLFYDKIRRYDPPLTLRCLNNLCAFSVSRRSLSWRVHLAQWTQYQRINLSIH